MKALSLFLETRKYKLLPEGQEVALEAEELLPVEFSSCNEQRRPVQ